MSTRHSFAEGSRLPGGTLGLALLGVLACAGCGGSPTQPGAAAPAPSVTSLTIDALTSAIPVGATFVPRAKVQLSDGSSLDVSSDATWLSDAPQVARIAAAGSVVAVSRGNATLTAVYRGVVAATQARIVDDWRGTWRTDHAVATCVAGFFRACFGSPETAVVMLTFAQSGDRLEGTVRLDILTTGLGSGGFSDYGVVSGTLADDGSVVLSGNMLDRYSEMPVTRIADWRVAVADGGLRAGAFTTMDFRSPIEGRVTLMTWTMDPFVRVTP